MKKFVLILLVLIAFKSITALMPIENFIIHSDDNFDTIFDEYRSHCIPLETVFTITFDNKPHHGTWQLLTELDDGMVSLEKESSTSQKTTFIFKAHKKGTLELAFRAGKEVLVKCRCPQKIVIYQIEVS